MKASATLVKALFVLASSPLWAQQPTPANPQTTPATPQSPAASQSPATQSPATSPTPATPSAAAPAVAMSPVSGELVSKLDSQTAKAGDDVVIQTKSSVKTSDGTEIPKGSKLKGHIVGVQASQGGTNSQVALKLDQIELAGGQTLPIQSQIQSIAPAGGADAAAGPSGGAAGPGSSPAPGASTAGVTPNRSAGGVSGASQSAAAPGAGSAPNGAPAPGGVPPAGTVIAKSGQIAIQTTSVPGVLLANNAPGEQDPRMARVSTVLLGAKKDIQLDGGTEMVVGVGIAPAAGTR